MYRGIGCSFKFCIFNYNSDCYCKRIKLDELGTCTSRIIVELNEDSVDAFKRHQLTQYNLETYGEYTTLPNRYKRLREVAAHNGEGETES